MPLLAGQSAQELLRAEAAFGSESPPTPSPSSRNAPVDRRGNLRPLIMFADAAFRSLSHGLTHGWIRNQQSQAIRQVCRVTAPETGSSIVHSVRFSETSLLRTQKPSTHRIHSNLKTFPRACINLGMDLRA
jgi:hypothetical protein